MESLHAKIVIIYISSHFVSCFIQRGRCEQNGVSNNEQDQLHEQQAFWKDVWTCLIRGLRGDLLYRVNERLDGKWRDDPHLFNLELLKEVQAYSSEDDEDMKE